MTRRPLYTPTDTIRREPVDKSVDGEDLYRSAFRRDYARLLHSPAFRRLQGKTQLFPSHESDFSRNRLTHSLEVAQVAKSIAAQINATDSYFQEYPIDTDLIEFAGLAHDLGHPPFGHNGEEALNEAMNGCGGFEGNAQTLRLVAKIEKRQVQGGATNRPIQKAKKKKVEDFRLGLNLTYRSIAAILKYNDPIGEDRKDVAEVEKGYYSLDRDIVLRVIENVCPDFDPKESFKTVECHIMDISDDIAYSTYDLEDAFKAGFLSPLKMLTATEDFKSKIANEVLVRCEKYYPDQRDYWKGFRVQDVDMVFQRVFSTLIEDWSFFLNRDSSDPSNYAMWVAATVNRVSDIWATDAYARTRFTSDLVSRFVNDIEVIHNENCPALTRVRLNIDAFLEVEVLKIFTYEHIIMSPMMKLAESRGKAIVRAIFDALTSEGGYQMLPSDSRSLYEEAVKIGDEKFAKRVVADFIAGMTDRYALEFYGRLKGANPPSIHKPH